MSSKLKIVTSEKLDLTGGEHYITKDGDLYIGLDREGESYLAYRNQDGNETRISFNSSDKNRPIYSSELVEKLKKCNWLVNKNIYQSDTTDDWRIIFCSRDSKALDSKGYIYDINQSLITEETNTSFPLTNLDKEITSYQFEQAWDNLFKNIPEEVKIEIENMAKSKEIYLFNDSREEIDFLNSSNSATLVDYNSGTYTNSLDLKSILSGKVCENNKTSMKVDLSIQYSTIDGKIINHNTTFEGLSVRNKELVMIDFIEEVGSDVTIEYLNGIIRLFPESERVVECIISNCSITYGNLE